jgi:hypothetical protein
MDFTAFNARMITDDKIKFYGVDKIKLGYEFQLRYPTYRGAYICNIEKLVVEVDGETIDQKDIRFGVNGKWFRMDEIREVYKEYWFTLDKATLRVLKDGGISSGEHTVKVVMDHKIPYTGYFGNYLVVTSDCTKKLSVES